MYVCLKQGPLKDIVRIYKIFNMHKLVLKALRALLERFITTSKLD